MTLTKMTWPGKVFPPFFLPARGASLKLRWDSVLEVAVLLLEDIGIDFSEAAEVLQKKVSGGMHIVIC